MYSGREQWQFIAIRSQMESRPLSQISPLLSTNIIHVYVHQQPKSRRIPQPGLTSIIRWIGLAASGESHSGRLVKGTPVRYITRRLAGAGALATIALLACCLAAPTMFAAPAHSANDVAHQATSSSLSASASSSDTTGQPCQGQTVRWPSSISQWTVPLGCFAGVFHINPNNYVYRSGFGWCNWWPEVLNPNDADVLHDANIAHPIPGAIVYFSPGVQGAGGSGHWAQVVAVSPGGYWVLITEMNFYWRGAGWQKVNYRFIHVGSGVQFKHDTN